MKYFEWSDAEKFEFKLLVHGFMVNFKVQSHASTIVAFTLRKLRRPTRIKARRVIYDLIEFIRSAPWLLEVVAGKC